MAKKILSAADDEVITILYDTTTRECIEGEWVALLVKFASDQSMFRLRPLYMAFEDRENIIALFVEQLKRLALAGNTSVQSIWKKITAIMTDSVAKNLKIAAGIAENIGSQHVPYHVLCIVHTCEKMDANSLESIFDGEKEMGLREKILNKMPSLASFMRNKKTIAELAIEAISKLVINTGHKTALHREFLDICNENDVSRKIGIYKQRRFAKLGYSAGSIVHHLPELKRLLTTHHSNQHSQACQLYLSIPFVIDSMVALSKITEFVILPFLNTVQKSDNLQLLHILPQLYTDLKHNKLDTLQKYYTSFNFKYPPETHTQNMLISLMANGIAEGLKLQRGREFRFPGCGEPRATDITMLPEHLLMALPTHNLDCERELSIFDRKVEGISGGFNQHSTFKAIRDEMVLHAANVSVPQRNQVRLFKELDLAEEKWTQVQEMKRTEKRKQKKRDAIKQQVRWKDLLALCRSWGGPCDTVLAMQEAESLMKTDPDRKMFLKTEILFNKLSNQQPSLNYGVNSKTLGELRSTLRSRIVFEESSDTSDAIEEEYDIAAYLMDRITKTQP